MKAAHSIHIWIILLYFNDVQGVMSHMKETYCDHVVSLLYLNAVGKKNKDDRESKVFL